MSPAASVAASLVSRVLPRVDELADRLVLAIAQDNPGHTRVVPEDDLWRSGRDTLIRVLGLVGDSGDRPGRAYDDHAQATGRRRAEQGLPLDDLLSSLRACGRVVWAALLAQAPALAVPADGLLEVGSRVWEVVDRTSTQLAIFYRDAERDVVRLDEQRRASMWERLLCGEGEDPELVTQAARMLGLPENGRYVVVAAQPMTDPTAQGSDAARRKRDRLTLVQVTSSWGARGASVVGLVAVSDPARRELDAVRDALEVRAGMSSPLHGLAQVHAGLRQAELALRTISAGERLAVLDERLVEALLVRCPDLAQQLVRSWLGPLLSLPEPERRPLLDTLDAWVATAGSVGRTAELVHCHRNTVLNRLRRLEHLTAGTGHDVTSGSPPVELSLALRAHRLPGHPL